MYHIAGIFQGLNFQGLASFLNFYDLIFEVILTCKPLYIEMVTINTSISSHIDRHLAADQLLLQLVSVFEFSFQVYTSHIKPYPVIYNQQQLLISCDHTLLQPGTQLELLAVYNYSTSVIVCTCMYAILLEAVTEL